MRDDHGLPWGAMGPCDLCETRETPRNRYRSFPPTSSLSTQMGNTIRTEKRYSSAKFEELTICDSCLEERRRRSWFLWLVVLVVSLPLVPFLFGIFGVIISLGMLVNLRRGNKDGVGDRIVAVTKRYSSKKKFIGIENDWKTRKEFAELSSS